MYIKTTSDWQAERAALMAELDEFANQIERRPFQNFQGLQGVSAFALYWFLKQVSPAVVFEVGVWKGFSTWLIEQAVPRAQVFCFDPMFLLEHLLDARQVGETYRSPRAEYSYQDFSCADVASLVGSRGDSALAFFDDHQNKMARLRQCKAAGIRHIIFDDNVAGCKTHRSLEDDRLRPQTRELLEGEVLRYEMFPALWPVDAEIDGQRIQETGLGFPVERRWKEIYNGRQWHSYVTYVQLR